MNNNFLYMDDSKRRSHIYTISTDAFYNDSEKPYHRKKMKTNNYIKHMVNEDKKREYNGEEKLHTKRIKRFEQRENKLKDIIKNMAKNNQAVRTMDPTFKRESNITSLFDSVLLRTMGIKEGQISDKLLTVEVYYEDILEDLIHDGFYLEGQHYQFFSASAGQTRNKEAMFINSAIYNNIEGSLTAGLTDDKINKDGGVNPSKYMAYKSLVSSASNEWVDFDINQTIVVDDLETPISAKWDYIDQNDFSITEQNMDVMSEQTDGAGMITPNITKRSMMVRAPWIKGLLVPFDFHQFAHEKAGTYIVTDIYNTEHDIRDVEVIFTKSQFKMSKFYNNWSEYQQGFNENKSQMAVMNLEDTSGGANFNYQMLQTLRMGNVTKDEIRKMAQTTINDIENMGHRDTMLKMMGAHKQKTPYQKALNMLPELLKDKYSTDSIKDIKSSMVKKAKAGKFEVDGAKYTYAEPDMYAMCQYIFGLEVTGLLEDGETHTNLHNHDKELDILRSPHLGVGEHCVRVNKRDTEKDKWFITNGIQLSIKDTIAHQLTADFDGDQLLVVPDETVVEVAKRASEGINPLQYSMPEGHAKTINSANLYHTLTNAYTANIGIISNNLSKIFNSNEEVDVDAVRYLVLLNNQTIDYAKTLSIVKFPDWVNKKIKKHTNKKLPHFFKYAKDKGENVEDVNNSPVNQLDDIIPNPHVKWRGEVGNLDYKLMMTKKTIKTDDALIKKFDDLNQSKGYRFNDKSNSNERKNNIPLIEETMKEELLKYGSEEYVTDQLVKYQYEKNTGHKVSLWSMFGDQIVKNIEQNMKHHARKCDNCQSNYRQKSKKQLVCPVCEEEIKRKNARKRKQKSRKSA